MGTRSTIAIEFKNGTVGQVYCHWDGYLSCNGSILQEHYSKYTKLSDLIKLGDFSTLRNTIAKTAKSCYKESDAHYYKNISDYFARGRQEEYDYIFQNVDGQYSWHVRYHGLWSKLRKNFITGEQV